MNELLGWYGYDKMARDDSSLLQGLPPPSSAASSTRMSSRSRKHSSEPLTSDPDSSDDEALSIHRRNRLNDKTQSTGKHIFLPESSLFADKSQNINSE